MIGKMCLGLMAMILGLLIVQGWAVAQVDRADNPYREAIAEMAAENLGLSLAEYHARLEQLRDLATAQCDQTEGCSDIWINMTTQAYGIYFANPLTGDQRAFRDSKPTKIEIVADTWEKWGAFITIVGVLLTAVAIVWRGPRVIGRLIYHLMAGAKRTASWSAKEFKKGFDG